MVFVNLMLRLLYGPTPPLRDRDWRIEENSIGEWLLMTDGEMSNGKYFVTRVRDGVTERHRYNPDERALQPNFAMKDFMAM